ncbi:MAG: flavin reductase family protein [Oscillibacter sp.]|nr:flavin reductase family protein [Oscillibacter sp.]MCI9375789.1 flavin reductase family protein [Oscillibacter sp.]MCI9481245.1 flavin reductase family protein [Oscillibacter sp.]
MKLHPVDVKTLRPEIFRLFQTQTPLLAAGTPGRCNVMTIGWGQLGTLWNKPVCTVYVRPERFTYQFMEENPFFSVCVLPEAYQNARAFCGSKSGRETDKIKECGLTAAFRPDGAPYLEEAGLVLVCRKLYVQDLDASCVLDHGLIDPYYGKMGRWHRAYTGEIAEVLET